MPLFGDAPYNSGKRNDVDVYKRQGPVIVKCDIHEDENVLPMVPGGQPLDNIILDLEK